MQRLLSSDLWPAVRVAAKKSKIRRAAIAYVTNELITFRRGDTLVVDASEGAIRAAATNAPLLARLNRKGVVIYDHPGLHAKVILFDRAAFVGSSNLSSSSQSALVEAGLLTDAKATLSQVESFIEQLIARSQRMDREQIRRLCRIEVKRRAGPWASVTRKKANITPLGDRTWLVAVTEDDREWTDAEKQELERAEERIRKKHSIRKDDITWIRWGRTGRFVSNGRAGERMIQISSATDKARPSFVHRATGVLHLLKIGRSTFVSVAESRGKKTRIRWGAFKQLMAHLGNRRPFGENSERVLEADLADAIDRAWNRA